MKLLLDQGAPRGAIALLTAAGHDAVHIGAMGFPEAEDAEILAIAQREARVVVTLDADFHTLLALSNASRPSVIRFRIEHLHAHRFAELTLRTLAEVHEQLERGAMVTVRHSGLGVRLLPLTVPGTDADHG